MSSKTLRNFLVLLVVIPAFFLILTWFLIIKPLAENRLNAALKNVEMLSNPNANNVGGAPLKVFFLGARSPALTINTKPIPIPLEQTSFELSALSLLSLTPKVMFTSNLFGGLVEGQMSYAISGGAANAELWARDVQLSKYQLASMLGVTAGSLTFKMALKSTAGNPISPGKIFFMLKGFSKPKASKLPQWISPLAITIPAIEGGEVIAEALCGLTECKSSRFSITSSLGQASGSFSFPVNRLGELQSSITVSLTQAGRTELLPYFALLNRDLLSAPDRPFLIKISGKTDNLKLAVVPIQNSL